MSRADHVRELDRLAHNLDARFRLFGIRFGWDSLIGWIPGLGDAATLLPSAYILYRGYRMGATTPTLARMAGNSAIDFVVGGIPLVGDLFDVGFKAILRNIELLKRDLALPEVPAKGDRPGIAAF